MAAFAQHEREQISARTKAGLAAKRARGEAMPHNYDFTAKDRAKAYKANSERAQDNDNNRKSVYEIKRYLLSGGKSTLQAIAAHLNDIGCCTARGKCHTHQSVNHLCQYYSIAR
jgi:DNA invertase Pin-like site-specific DNA recombinase